MSDPSVAATETLPCSLVPRSCPLGDALRVCEASGKLPGASSDDDSGNSTSTASRGQAVSMASKINTTYASCPDTCCSCACAAPPDSSTKTWTDRRAPSRAESGRGPTSRRTTGTRRPGRTGCGCPRGTAVGVWPGACAPRVWRSGGGGWRGRSVALCARRRARRATRYNAMWACGGRT